MDMLEGGETGIGNYTIEISVAAEAGNAQVQSVPVMMVEKK